MQQKKIQIALSFLFLASSMTVSAMGDIKNKALEVLTKNSVKLVAAGGTFFAVNSLSASFGYYCGKTSHKNCVEKDKIKKAFGCFPANKPLPKNWPMVLKNHFIQKAIEKGREEGRNEERPDEIKNCFAVIRKLYDKKKNEALPVSWPDDLLKSWKQISDFTGLKVLPGNGNLNGALKSIVTNAEVRQKKFILNALKLQNWPTELRKLDIADFVKNHIAKNYVPIGEQKKLQKSLSEK